MRNISNHENMVLHRKAIKESVAFLDQHKKKVSAVYRNGIVQAIVGGIFRLHRSIYHFEKGGSSSREANEKKM
ncbi:MAG: hypothetical protein IPL08_18065 [Saprospiraceae bacterium]|nr:hypothetical protein [Saprospiraceae bacterium]